MMDIKQRSRESLRLQIMRGTEEEVWPAFEELMRRNMEASGTGGDNVHPEDVETKWDDGSKWNDGSKWK